MTTSSPAYGMLQPLPFPCRTSARDKQGKIMGIPSQEYDIPEEHKLAVLNALNPIDHKWSLGDTALDLHHDKEFVVRDFKVIRELGLNYLVSPYYYASGGTIIDWIPIK